MSPKALAKLIAAGRGQGHFEDYLSWLAVSRSNVSPFSAREAGRVPPYRRRFNFMCDSEWWLTLLLLWLGATDVREQFPAWPWAHPHPLADYPRCVWTGDGFVPGLLEIASTAGIDHGVYIGTTLPFVATIDVVATLQRESAARLFAFACKPRELIAAGDPLGRVGERLELQRLYANAVRAGWFTVDRELFPTALVGNLESLCPTKETLEGFAANSRFETFREFVTERQGEMSLRDLRRAGCEKVGWGQEAGRTAMHLLMWRQDIDVDITQPILTSRPPRPGGQRVRAALQMRIFGERLT